MAILDQIVTYFLNAIACLGTPSRVVMAREKLQGHIAFFKCLAFRLGLVVDVHIYDLWLMCIYGL